MSKYYKDLNVKIIFSPFKLSTTFIPKDFVHDSLKSPIVRAVELHLSGQKFPHF